MVLAVVQILIFMINPVDQFISITLPSAKIHQLHNPKSVQEMGFF